MKSGKARWLVFVLCGVLVVGIVLSLAKSGALVDMYQVAESDGHRQLEYKILGVIPFEKQETSPKTRVTEDYWRNMAKTGIKFGSELDRKKLGLRAVRIVRRHETEYWLRTDVKADHVALVAKYAAQLKSPDPYSRTWTYHSPRSPKPALDIKVLIDLRAKGAKPGEDLCDFGIGVTVPK